MVKLDIKAPVFDALSFAKNCQLYAKKINHDQFQNDHLTMSAIQYNLIVLSEALKRIGSISPEICKENPEKKFIELGDELLEKYDDVDSYKIWIAIQNELPSLISSVEKLLSDKK